MGTNSNEKEKDTFGMNIFVFGDKILNFYNIISKIDIKNNIKSIIKQYWDFDYKETEQLHNYISPYFENLKKKQSEDLTIKNRETLIVKIKNLSGSDVDLILDRMNKLGQTHLMPLVLFLIDDNHISESEMKIQIDKKKYKKVDERLIFLAKFTDNPAIIDKEIDPILLRICSIHNELGDRFTVGKGDKGVDYDLIEKYFPFNINIACIGRFGQGKSTGVNAILKEYKAKESSKGSSQTKKLTFYQALNKPVRVLDIPGFENPETVKKAVEQLQLCGEKIKKINDNLHIILYFIKYSEDRKFMELEYPIIEEVVKHKSSKLIYVITHSNPEIEEDDIEEEIKRINEGLQGITKDKKKNIVDEVKQGGKLFASKDNVVFVNFHKDLKSKFEPFGKKDLFQKIHDFFIESDDYKKSLEKLDKEKINENAKKLREEGKDLLFANKVWGGVVGIIPGVDWALQKFVVKKNAAKKLGELFGIDVKFVNEETKPKVKKGKKKADYVTEGMDDDLLSLKGDELIKESKTFKVGNSIKVAGETGTYVAGGSAVTTGIFRASSTIIETTTTAGEIFGATALKLIGSGCLIAGAVIGVGLGSYFTHDYCETLLDKFVDYYKNNADLISNSYKDAAKYFLFEGNE